MLCPTGNIKMHQKMTFLHLGNLAEQLKVVSPYICILTGSRENRAHNPGVAKWHALQTEPHKTLVRLPEILM
jgi:hypothetical protein